MQRIATISLPAKAKTVGNLLAALVDNTRSTVYVQARSNGLGIYIEDYCEEAMGSYTRKQLRR